MQAEPFRGLRHSLESLTEAPVHYVERGFIDESTTWEWVKAAVKSRGPMELAEHAFVFFAFPTRPTADRIFQQIMDLRYNGGMRPVEIAHDFQRPDTLVEVHPGLWMTLEQIVDQAVEGTQGRRLVPDYWHIRHEATKEWQQGMPSGLRRKSLLPTRWEETLEATLPHSRAIHLQPRRDTDELSRCLEGRCTELEDMVAATRQLLWSGDVVLEALMPQRWRLLDHRAVAATMREFSHWAHEAFGLPFPLHMDTVIP